MSAVLLTATSAVAGGCSPAEVVRDGPTITLPHLVHAPSHAGATTPPAPTSSPARDQGRTAAGAARAWQASMNAFYEAALGARPEDPAFVRTLVAGGPLYTHAVAYLTELATAGVRGPSTWRVGRAAAKDVTTSSATVTGCSFDTGSRLGSSGRPAPAALGGGAGYTATTAFLVWSQSRWLVLRARSSQVRPSQEGPCRGF